MGSVIEQSRAAHRRAWLRAGLLVLALLIVAGAYLGWSRGFREEAQPAWVFESPEMRFKYGSIGAEHDAGIPYWIFYVLPRGFPEEFLPDGQLAPGGNAQVNVVQHLPRAEGLVDAVDGQRQAAFQTVENAHCPPALA